MKYLSLLWLKVVSFVNEIVLTSSPPYRRANPPKSMFDVIVTFSVFLKKLVKRGSVFS